MTSNPLALQLYTVRDQLASGREAVLKAIRDFGYGAVEPYDVRTDPEALRADLEEAGLAVCSVHARALGDDAGPLLDGARTVGADTVIVPSVPAERFADAAAIAALAREFNEAAARAAGQGLRLGYHNHAFEFGPVDLWSRIVASGLDLELDVGWLRVAGRDPVAELEQHAGRLLLVHAKDVRPEGDGWLDVVAGDGELDFEAIARAAEAAGASRLIVELDTPSDDPVEDSRRSLATLQAVL